MKEKLCKRQTTQKSRFVRLQSFLLNKRKVVLFYRNVSTLGQKVWNA